MAITQIADIIVPEIYNPYFDKLTTRLDAFIQAGVVGGLDNITFPDGGDTINVPYLNDLSGDSEILDDDGALTPAKRTAGKMRARVQFRGKAWAANELAAVLAGRDPLDNIATLDVKYWVGERQKVLLNSLAGFFTTAGAANVLDITGGTGAAAVIDGSSFVDATQKLGDHKGTLSLVAMHSATEAVLAKADLIQYVEESGQSDRIPTFMNKRVIVDDSLPVDTGDYTTYIFGANSVGYTAGNPPKLTRTETDRDSLRGDDFFIRREAFIMHPQGADWTESSVAAASPTSAELATAANWALWEDQKNVRIVQFKHKIA